MFIAKKEGGLKILDATHIKQSNTLRDKILSLLAEGESYPREMARKLKTDKQRIYYHIKQLEKRGFIKLHRREDKGGALAKYYRLTAPAFVFMYRPMQKARRVPRSSAGVLSGHIKGGSLDSFIVIGSPDPHGLERARSRDISYVTDLALFLGTFISSYEQPKVMLDTNIHAHDMKENMIVIGGPVINKVTKAINNSLPVKFDKNKNIYSSITKKTYKNEYCGMIVNAENPYNAGKRILMIAGKRFHGTRAAVIALMKNFDKISLHRSSIIEGLDEDGDGIVDNVKILEQG